MKDKIFSGRWNSSLPVFKLVNNAGEIKIRGDRAEVKIRNRIIKINKDFIEEEINNQLIIKGQRCPICKTRTLVGYWTDYIPLLINDNLNKTLVISDVLSNKVDIVEYCENCKIFICKNKIFEIYNGSEQEVIRSIKKIAENEKGYYTLIKKGAFIGGSIFTSFYYIFLSLLAYKEMVPELGSLFGMIFAFIFLPIAAFLTGVPFGAGIGAGIWRKKIKTNKK